MRIAQIFCKLFNGGAVIQMVTKSTGWLCYGWWAQLTWSTRGSLGVAVTTNSRFFVKGFWTYPRLRGPLIPPICIILYDPRPPVNTENPDKHSRSQHTPRQRRRPRYHRFILKQSIHPVDHECGVYPRYSLQNYVKQTMVHNAGFVASFPGCGFLL